MLTGYRAFTGSMPYRSTADPTVFLQPVMNNSDSPSYNSPFIKRPQLWSVDNDHSPLLQQHSSMSGVYAKGRQYPPCHLLLFFCKDAKTPKTRLSLLGHHFKFQIRCVLSLFLFFAGFNPSGFGLSVNNCFLFIPCIPLSFPILCSSPSVFVYQFRIRIHFFLTIDCTRDVNAL